MKFRQFLDQCLDGDTKELGKLGGFAKKKVASDEKKPDATLDAPKDTGAKDDTHAKEPASTVDPKVEEKPKDEPKKEEPKKEEPKKEEPKKEEKPEPKKEEPEDGKKGGLGKVAESFGFMSQLRKL